MSAVIAVIGRLAAVSAVTALVPATRMYNGEFPQSVSLPAIRAQRIGGTETPHLRGSSIRRTRVQIDTVAGSGNPITDALAVDAAVRGNGAGSSLIGWQGTVGTVRVLSVLADGDPRELYDAEELRQYRVIRDVIVTWTDA